MDEAEQSALNDVFSARSSIFRVRRARRSLFVAAKPRHGVLVPLFSDDGVPYSGKRARRHRGRARRAAMILHNVGPRLAALADRETSASRSRDASSRGRCASWLKGRQLARALALSGGCPGVVANLLALWSDRQAFNVRPSAPRELIRPAKLGDRGSAGSSWTGPSRSGREGLGGALPAARAFLRRGGVSANCYVSTGCVSLSESGLEFGSGSRPNRRHCRARRTGLR